MSAASSSAHRAKTIVAYAAAAVIGAVAFFVAFPSYILDPTFLEWVFPHVSSTYNGGDFHTHYLGWRFLRQVSWSFPLGLISNYVSPLGTYIAYTDSLPLLAFPLRLISDLLPADFQYLGAWVLFCFILQSIFAFRILRRWVHDPFCLALGVIFLTFSPVLIFRWNHVALMSHWLLLWSFEVLQNNLNLKRPFVVTKVAIWQPIIIISMATLIQPYLAAMVAGICWTLPLAQFLSEERQEKNWWVWPLLRLGAITAAYILPMGVLLYSFGFLGGPSGTEGFHFFGTDFFSLFNNYGTSSFIPKFRVKRGLYEGYAWPGLGGWLLICAVLVTRVRTQVRDWMRDPFVTAILITCGLMWFFALSENIHFFGFWIIDMEWFWKPLHFVTSSLRTSGRFIWPLYYLLFMTAIAVTANFYPKKIARWIFTAALLAQVVDIGPWIANRSSRFPITRGSKLADPFWTAAASNYRHIKIIPPVQDVGFCFQQKGDIFYQWVEFADFAAKNNMTINSGYLARYDRNASQLYCGAQSYEFITGPLQTDSLYVLRPGYFEKMPTSGSDRVCKAIDGFITCVASMSDKLKP